MSAQHEFVSRLPTGDPLCKLVLKCLADYLDRDGVCWVSISILAQDCECSEATVRRKLHDLQKKQLIHLETVVGQPNVITLYGFKEWFLSCKRGAKNVCTN